MISWIKQLAGLIAGFPQSELSELAFISSGTGIKNRWDRWRPFWELHIAKTREAQEQWLPRLSAAGCQQLRVYGAGRLIDFNDSALCPQLKDLELFDADESAAKEWRQLAVRYPQLKIVSRIEDITGKLHLWKTSIEAHSNSWESALAALERLPSLRPLRQMEPIQIASGDCILSLNLLSQLPIHWQQVVEQILIKKFGRTLVAQNEQAWLKSALPSRKMLVEDHLALLNSSAAKQILLITDLEFVEYRGTKYYHPGNPAASPLAWNAFSESDPAYIRLGNWSADESITSWELYSPLAGIDLEYRSTLAEKLSHYDLVNSNCWLWHIAPQGLGDRKLGYVHRVCAFFLSGKFC